MIMIMTYKPLNIFKVPALIYDKNVYTITIHFTFK